MKQMLKMLSKFLYSSKLDFFLELSEPSLNLMGSDYVTNLFIFEWNLN